MADVFRPVWNNGAFYASLSGGAAFMKDGRVDVANNPSGAANFDYDTGFSMGLRAGYDFGSLRVEGELSHTQADITSLDTTTGPVGVNSKYSDLGFMVNALWDFDFKPFVVSVGVGIGATSVEYDQMANGGFIAVADSKETVFTSQLILSASYQINPATSLALSYRYQMQSDLSDRGYVDTGVGGPSDIDFDGADIGIVELALIYRF